MKTKITSALLVIGLIIAMISIPVLADSNMIDASYAPDGNPICPVCELGQMVHLDDPGPWHQAGTQRFCIHCRYGVDLKEECHIITYWHCTYCAYEYDESWTEIRWACHGFN